jgi:hypothetical protein
MKSRIVLPLLIGVVVAAAGCKYDAANVNGAGGTAEAVATRKVAGPLPDNAFKAQLEVVDPPTKLRAGEKATIQIKVKNASDAQWYSRGGEVNENPDNRFYIAAGNRWLKADGQTLVTNMDGRYGLPNDLKTGEESTVPLQITAPKEPGDYVLEIDLVQEQVTWFSEKGSPTAKVKISVVK